ncbi:MAG: hypothetical protein HQM00_15510, partial [Magnetococcales bacterium]|nr:hypothetical protein [Magnetococcales bacterium]
LLPEWREEVTRVMTALGGMAPEVSPLAAAGKVALTDLDKPRVREMFESLAALIDDGDSEAQEVAGAVMELLVGSELADAMTRLIAQIDDYEFEMARSTLNELVTLLDR